VSVKVPWLIKKMICFGASREPLQASIAGAPNPTSDEQEFRVSRGRWKHFASINPSTRRREDTRQQEIPVTCISSICLNLEAATSY